MRVARLGEVYYGEPIVTADSIRVVIDPRTNEFRQGVIYELVFDVPDWSIISTIVEHAIKWWTENVKGLEVLSAYQEVIDGNKYLVLQVRKRTKEPLLRKIIEYYTIFARAMFGLVGYLIGFILSGIRLFLSGILCFVGAWAVFNLAYGWYKLFALPLIPLGAYLMIKPIKETIKR